MTKTSIPSQAPWSTPPLPRPRAQADPNETSGQLPARLLSLRVHSTEAQGELTADDCDHQHGDRSSRCPLGASLDASDTRETSAAAAADAVDHRDLHLRVWLHRRLGLGLALQL